MSETAKSGFVTEDQVVTEFHNWSNSVTAKKWLLVIGYSKIKTVKAKTTRSMGINSKADILVEVNASNPIGISIKKFTASFNQIDKRKVDNYQKIWNIPNDVVIILKKYCGQQGYRPMDKNPIPQVKDQRRYFLTELTQDEQKRILNFFEQNKSIIIHDILRGNVEPKADYMLVVKKNGSGIEESTITKIENVISHYDGSVEITKRGNLKLGKITVQRKGGNGGSITAQMLQFKFSPKEVLLL